MSVQELFLRYQTVLRPLLRIGPLFGGVAILFWRVRETRVPLTVKAIVIPPLAMSTGFFMFLSPPLRVPLLWAVVSFLFGALVLSYPIIRTSHLKLRDGVVHLQRSRWFLAILLILLAIRLLLHDYIGQHISPLQTAAVFYLMAFGMIVRWRAGMYWEYQKITVG
jgi:membrane protein CcdC involved in cytochrome C biogenesis